MASYEEIFGTSVQTQPNVLQRSKAAPLDRASMFSSYNDAVEYAKGPYKAEGERRASAHDSRKLAGVSYIGQIISVYENDSVKIYVIDADRTLKEVGGFDNFTGVDCGPYDRDE